MHAHKSQSPQTKEENFHLVALTSSTLGSLKLDLMDHKIEEEEEEKDVTLGGSIKKKEDFAMGMFEAKTWSKMIDQKIPKIVPKTPTRTPPGEPETIDAWELMEGLEDTSPLVLKPPLHQIRSFSFHLASDHHRSFGDYPTPKVHENVEETAIKPLWLESGDDESNSTSNGTSIVSEFDPEVIDSFRKALEELPPANPFHMKPLMNENQDGKDQILDVNDDDDSEKVINGISEECNKAKEKVIVYFTSLRGVRKTYEDGCNVRVILKGLGLKVDERDVSMHSGFKDEMKELLGEGWFRSGALPKVFIGRRYIGGAEEIHRMHEEGRLEKEVEGCEMDGGGGGGIGNVCEACGDVRFVPCDTCSGSCKIYYEGEYDDEGYSEESEYGFHRCPDCNENGLIRCPICCDE